ncbi:MAG: adenylate cyclase, partial [Gammaproteobacteria bacterium]
MSTDTVKRKLTTVFYADVVGYSRLTGNDEVGTHRTVMSTLDTVAHTVEARSGAVLRYAGDAVLAEFPSVVECVQAACAIQNELALRNRDLPPGDQVLIRIGINLGEVLQDRGEIFGDGVNLAARLEAFAEPGGVCVSDLVHGQIEGKTELIFTDAGEQSFKNISRALRVYRWQPESLHAAALRVDLPTVGEKPLVAVLPFDSMSGDQETRFLADGLCEDLTTALSKIDAFTVVSRTTAFEFRARGRGAAHARSELGASYLVEGSARTAGRRVRINAQLIELVNGNHLWAEKFDGSIDEIFDLQDDISSRIVTALEVYLSDGQQVLAWRGEAGDNRAYEHFLAARAAYKDYSRSGNVRARRSYEEALASSPSFVSATVGLARTHIEDASFGWSTDRASSTANARRLLDAIFASHPDHAPALAELAHLFMVEGDFQSAREVATRGVNSDPTLADAHHVLAIVLVCLG